MSEPAQHAAVRAEPYMILHCLLMEPHFIKDPHTKDPRLGVRQACGASYRYCTRDHSLVSVAA